MSWNMALRRWSAGAVIASTAACGWSVRRPTVYEPAALEANELNARSLRIHMHDGRMYALGAWQFDGEQEAITGNGVMFDLNRVPLDSGIFSIHRDSVALVESEGRDTVRPVGPSVLAVMTTLWGVTTAVCVADPKSCFGSCPTFYVDDVSSDRPLAEGFSSSIAKVLEARDVDALGIVRRGGERVDVRMLNEALETHAVRHVRLHAVPQPRAAGSEVVVTSDGGFYVARHAVHPADCVAAEGSCLGALLAIDEVERTSDADSTDLGVMETLDLVFPPKRGSVGLVLSARQTFVSTFLLYQTMSYMGRKVSGWLADLERGDLLARSAVQGVNDIIGKINVSVSERGRVWSDVGTFREAGPIATDVQVIPFGVSETTDSLRVRLTMARGAWRVGYASLVTLGLPIQPVVLDPILIEARQDAARDFQRSLLDGDRYLYTYPGDEYLLRFRLPEGTGEFELFLEAQGYYYEWMRAEWYEEEDPAMVAMLLLRPREALKVMAPSFKQREQDFEERFWQSRFGR